MLQIAVMAIMLVLLLLSSYVAAILARAALIAWQVKRAAEGKQLWPISFASRKLLAPPGDAPILALGADTWRPMGNGANAAVAGGRARGFTVFRHGVAIGRSAWILVRHRVRRVIDGREREDRGWMIVTDRRVGWRGRHDAFDIPLNDIEHLEVRRPLLELRRRSHPRQPLVVRVPQPASVAQLIAVLSARSMGYTVTVAPAAVGARSGRP